MKTFKALIVMMVTIFTFHAAMAQSDKSAKAIDTSTQTFKVSGVCGMCKQRIEKTALSVEGVMSADWDEDTQMLILGYSTLKKKTVDKVQKKLAAAGHDNARYNAKNAVYNALPGCCHYRNS